MSNLNQAASTDATNDFEEIFVDRIKGHDQPGYLVAEQGASFPVGVAVGTTLSRFSTVSPILLANTLQQNRFGPLVHIWNGTPAFRQGQGEYLLVQSGNEKVFRVNPINDSNPQNFLVEIADANYGSQGAPVLRIGGNTAAAARRFADNDSIDNRNSNVRYPGAIRLDTQQADHAVTMFATYDGGTGAQPFGIQDTDGPRRYVGNKLSRNDDSLSYLDTPAATTTRAFARLMYRGDAGYKHGTAAISQIDDDSSSGGAARLRQNVYSVAVDYPSFSKFKEILGEGTPNEDALALIVELSKHLKCFRYNEEGSYPVENGIILDNAPIRYIDGNRETQEGKINTLTLYGDLVASVAELDQQNTIAHTKIQHLNERLTAERARSDKLEQRLADLTARLEVLEAA